MAGAQLAFYGIGISHQEQLALAGPRLYGAPHDLSRSPVSSHRIKGDSRHGFYASSAVRCLMMMTRRPL